MMDRAEWIAWMMSTGREVHAATSPTKELFGEKDEPVRAVYQLTSPLPCVLAGLFVEPAAGVVVRELAIKPFQPIIKAPLPFDVFLRPPYHALGLAGAELLPGMALTVVLEHSSPKPLMLEWASLAPAAWAHHGGARGARRGVRFGVKV